MNKNKVRSVETPSKRQDVTYTKRKVFVYRGRRGPHCPAVQRRKGDIRRYKGHAGSGEESRRKELKNVVYFGGLYPGKDNGKLWEEVKAYIENQYEVEAIEKIYFQSDGGSWMKKGIEVLGAEFVLDGFHLHSYVSYMLTG